MLAVVEVDAAGQAAKRGKGKAADEEGQRTPQRELVAAARKHRQPTPDHPPYCWMIGEAIEALAENGGSTEDSISAFICARYPGVPPAHDRLLRHYLGKHVAEGFFARTAAGRYDLVPEENADEKLLVEQAEAGSCCKPPSVGSSVVEAKPGRGRPPSTPPASRKDGRAAGAQRTTPPEGSSSALVVAAAAKDSVPMSPVAVADKDEIQAASLKPKRRRRRQRISSLGMATTTDSSGEALVAGKKDDTLDKEHEPRRELAPVILGDSSAASAMDKACTEVPPPTTAPVDGGQPLDLALVITTELSVPLPVPAAAPMPASPPTTPPVDGGQPLDLALVTTTEVPVPVPAPMPAMDKDGGDASSIMDKNAPMPATDKGNGDASSIVDKNNSICTTPTAPEPSNRACKLALMAAAADGTVPLLVADKKDGLKEARSASYKDVHQPRKAGSAPTARKKDDGKALPATPKGRRRQRKSAPVIAGGCPTPASATDQGSREASAMLKQHDQPRKLYPVTADEISDSPGIVLLALAASNP